ncbi:MAG: NifB/NifX family molybdenum-iron cluster-binding protein [Candidatus Hodarchaeota archaeon]
MDKIVVSSQGPGGLDALVDPRFARCPVFTVIDVSDGVIKLADVVQNTSADRPRGAGIQAAQIVANLGAKAVIAGNLGPNALGSLKQLGIKVLAAPLGMTIRDVIQKYLEGALTEITTPTTLGMGGGQGMGRGLGRGSGRGRGRQR